MPRRRSLGSGKPKRSPDKNVKKKKTLPNKFKPDNDRSPNKNKQKRKLDDDKQ